jgi:NAD+ synthase
MKTSDINFNISLDENHVPEKIEWNATDTGETENKEAKAIMMSLWDAKEEDRKMGLVNTRARLRMTTLYYFAALSNYLVLGTGNKVEDFGVGFYTKYGDGGVDVSPIADLVKTEVYALGKTLNIINDIIVAPPTDGLWGDERTDEDQIGASYPELEWAMEVVEKGIVDFTTFTSRQQEVFQIYTRLNTINQHKMEPIPVCIIPKELKL